MVIKTLNDDIVDFIKNSHAQGLTRSLNEMQYSVASFLGLVPDDVTKYGYNVALGDPMVKYSLLNDKRENVVAETAIKPLIRLWDKNMNFISVLNPDYEASWEEIDRDTGECNFTLRRNDWVGQFFVDGTPYHEDLNITIDPYPHRRNWRWRWGGKIISINIMREEDGVEKIQVKAVSNREHLKHILYSATPISPPEFQPIRMYILPGPTRTIITLTTFLNLARIFFPPLALIGNILNPGEWFNQNLLSVNPLNWPLQVALINPLTDTSRWSVIGSRWQNMHTVTSGVLEDSGCTARVYTWLTEDEDSPNDEFNLETAAIDSMQIVVAKATAKGDYSHEQIKDFLERAKNSGFDGQIIEDNAGVPIGIHTLNKGDIFIDKTSTSINRVINSLFRPWRNCNVISIEDHSGVQGVTGTIVDGVIRLVAETLDDTITELIFPLDTDRDSRTDPVFAKLMSIMPEVSPITWRDGSNYSSPAMQDELHIKDGRVQSRKVERFMNSGITHSDRVIHKRTAKHIMVGGHSPGWVNQGITFGIRFGLEQLSQVIYTGPNGFGAVASLQAILSSGLDNLYQGQFDDMVLAWQRYTNPLTDTFTGSHGFQEHFETGNGTAWTLSGGLSLRQGWYKTRAYEIFKIKVENGYPYTVYKDFNLSDRMNFEIFGIIYVDQLTAIKHSYSQEKPMEIELSIGNDSRDTDPLGQAVSMIATITDVLSVVIGGNESF